MNKTISLAAITLVAVVMGMSVFAPAFSDGPQAKADVCHNDDGADDIRGNADDGWEVINVNGHSVSKHVSNHFDVDGQFDFEIGVGGTQAECDLLIDADPLP